MSSSNYNRAVSHSDGSFFSVKIEDAKNGLKTLLINDKYVHSKFKPESDGDGTEFNSKSLIAVFGLGLGYHVRNILKSNPESIIVVFEPLDEIFNLKEKCLPDLADNDRVVIVNDCQAGYLFSLLEKFFSNSFVRLKTYSHRTYASIMQSSEADFFSNISKVYKMFIQNIMTESNFIPLWFKNTVYNLVKSGRLVSIKNINMERNTAVVCGAGPTLKDNIPFMKQNRRNLTIFASDTALIPLADSGIEPDVVVSLDGQHYSIEDFVVSSNSLFIFDILAMPSLRNIKSEKILTTHSYKDNSFPAWFFNKLSISPESINTGGTVSDYTLDIAVKSGFKRIILAGYDLSFPGNITHTNSSPYHKRLIRQTDYYNTISDKFLKSISLRNPFYADSYRSDKVFTDFVMSNYRSYLEEYIRVFNDIEYLTLSDKAVSVNGVKYVSEDYVLKDLKGKPVKIEVEEIYSGAGGKEILNELLMSLFEYSNNLSALIGKISWETADYSGLEELSKLMSVILSAYPFIESFIIMTDVILDSKGIDDKSVLYYKHKSFRLLQSIFFIIRTLQKALL